MKRKTSYTGWSTEIKIKFWSIRKHPWAFYQVAKVEWIKDNVVKGASSWSWQYATVTVYRLGRGPESWWKFTIHTFYGRRLKQLSKKVGLEERLTTVATENIVLWQKY